MMGAVFHHRFGSSGTHPAIFPRADREPAGVGALRGSPKSCDLNFWTRSVELEDFLGRIAPGAGTSENDVHLALILMGGWCGLDRH